MPLYSGFVLMGSGITVGFTGIASGIAIAFRGRDEAGLLGEFCLILMEMKGSCV